MLIQTVDEKIKRLQDIKKQLKKDMGAIHVDATDLRLLYEQVDEKTQVWRCHNTEPDYTHFYFNEETDPGKKQTASIIEGLVPYEQSLFQTQSSFDGRVTMVTFQKQQTEMCGASIILPEKKQSILIYEPIYESIRKYGAQYVSVRDTQKRISESIATQNGDIYRIRINGKYIEDFAWRKVKTFKDASSSKVGILYFREKPVYLSSYDLSTKNDLARFQNTRLLKGKFSDEIYQIITDFDENFMAGEYGPQKEFSIKR